MSSTENVEIISYIFDLCYHGGEVPVIHPLENISNICGNWCNGMSLGVSPACFNIGGKRRIRMIASEVKYNIAMRDKAFRLSRVYENWRKIRGDGNCFYRAVGFGLLEIIINGRNASNLLSLSSRFQQCLEFWTQRWSDIKSLNFKAQNEALLCLKILCEKLSTFKKDNFLGIRAMGLENSFNLIDDYSLDSIYIQAVRLLLAQYILVNANKDMNGIPLSDIILSSFEDISDLEDYCHKYIIPMGVDAEGPFVSGGILFEALGCGGVMIFLDRRPDVDLTVLGYEGRTSSSPQDLIDFERDQYEFVEAGDIDWQLHEGMNKDLDKEGGRAIVHILLQPGHYDLLYPKPEFLNNFRASQEAVMARQEPSVAASPTSGGGAVGAVSGLVDLITNQIGANPSRTSSTSTSTGVTIGGDTAGNLKEIFENEELAIKYQIHRAAIIDIIDKSIQQSPPASQQQQQQHKSNYLYSSSLLLSSPFSTKKKTITISSLFKYDVLRKFLEKSPHKYLFIHGADSNGLLIFEPISWDISFYDASTLNAQIMDCLNIPRGRKIQLIPEQEFQKLIFSNDFSPTKPSEYDQDNNNNNNNNNNITQEQWKITEGQTYVVIVEDVFTVWVSLSADLMMSIWSPKPSSHGENTRSRLNNIAHNLNFNQKWLVTIDMKAIREMVFVNYNPVSLGEVLYQAVKRERARFEDSVRRVEVEVEEEFVREDRHAGAHKREHDEIDDERAHTISTNEAALKQKKSEVEPSMPVTSSSSVLREVNQREPSQSQSQYPGDHGWSIVSVEESPRQEEMNERREGLLSKAKEGLLSKAKDLSNSGGASGSGGAVASVRTAWEDQSAVSTTILSHASGPAQSVGGSDEKQGDGPVLSSESSLISGEIDRHGHSRFQSGRDIGQSAAKNHTEMTNHTERSSGDGKRCTQCGRVATDSNPIFQLRSCTHSICKNCFHNYLDDFAKSSHSRSIFMHISGVSMAGELQPYLRVICCPIEGCPSYICEDDLAIVADSPMMEVWCNSCKNEVGGSHKINVSQPSAKVSASYATRDQRLDLNSVYSPLLGYKEDAEKIDVDSVYFRTTMPVEAVSNGREDIGRADDYKYNDAKQDVKEAKLTGDDGDDDSDYMVVDNDYRSEEKWIDSLRSSRGFSFDDSQVTKKEVKAAKARSSSSGRLRPNKSSLPFTDSTAKSITNARAMVQSASAATGASLVDTDSDGGRALKSTGRESALTSRMSPIQGERLESAQSAATQMSSKILSTYTQKCIFCDEVESDVNPVTELYNCHHRVCKGCLHEYLMDRGDGFPSKSIFRMVYVTDPINGYQPSLVEIKCPVETCKWLLCQEDLDVVTDSPMMDVWYKACEEYHQKLKLYPSSNRTDDTMRYNKLERPFSMSETRNSNTLDRQYDTHTYTSAASQERHAISLENKTLLTQSKPYNMDCMVCGFPSSTIISIKNCQHNICKYCLLGVFKRFVNLHPESPTIFDVQPVTSFGSLKLVENLKPILCPVRGCRADLRVDDTEKLLGHWTVRSWRNIAFEEYQKLQARSMSRVSDPQSSTTKNTSLGDPSYSNKYSYSNFNQHQLEASVQQRMDEDIVDPNTDTKSLYQQSKTRSLGYRSPAKPAVEGPFRSTVSPDLKQSSRSTTHQQGVSSANICSNCGSESGTVINLLSCSHTVCVPCIISSYNQGKLSGSSRSGLYAQSFKCPLSTCGMFLVNSDSDAVKRFLIQNQAERSVDMQSSVSSVRSTATRDRGDMSHLSASKCCFSDVLHCDTDRSNVNDGVVSLGCGHNFHPNCLLQCFKATMKLGTHRSRWPLICPQCERSNNRCQCARCIKHGNNPIYREHIMMDEEIYDLYSKLKESSEKTALEALFIRHNGSMLARASIINGKCVLTCNKGHALSKDKYCSTCKVAFCPQCLQIKGHKYTCDWVVSDREGHRWRSFKQWRDQVN